VPIITAGVSSLERIWKIKNGVNTVKVNINKFVQEDGSLVIPKEMIEFVKFPKEIVLKKCLECGKEFYQTHEKEKFCPPLDTVRSRCENRYNQRLKRQRRKEKESGKQEEVR
jgi:hypothetical protein